MTNSNRGRRVSPAWYSGTRLEFLQASRDSIANQLAGRAADECLSIEQEQAREWKRSVELLQHTLGERIAVLRNAIESPGNEAIHHVILEFDFRRRGLRMDCLLLADGILFVVEFKRSTLGRADRDQVMNYGVNLFEFHKVTRNWCESGDAIVVPMLVLTHGRSQRSLQWPGLAGHSWPSLTRKPLECDATSFGKALAMGLRERRSDTSVSWRRWIESPFQPSSSILDATISLFGNHDVAAIAEHAAPKAAIDASIGEVSEHIDATLTNNEYRVIFVSGAPGAGKTLVGLDIVMRGNHARDSVFVTGNAPLVDVLNKALSASYRTQAQTAASWTLTGYRRADAALVGAAASYKIVKAHNFLGNRGEAHHQEDGRVLIFDEAQRTYEMGRTVLGVPLEDHEADLVLRVQRAAFPAGGAVVVALVGHNQAINRGERGITAWLEAAERQGWKYSISDETLELSEFRISGRWGLNPNRRLLQNGHLRQSMRFYRNAAMEEWVSAALDGDAGRAKEIADKLTLNECTIWLTRDLDAARKWAKPLAIGGLRAGLIASGQARRLAAEGLFVDYKPDIATWMLAPNSDVRASTSLETVQNQYQVQGLELDYCIVCWDADLRREGDNWVAYKMRGSDWQRDNLPEVAKNGYRVLLTRARKGLMIFIPSGDQSGDDEQEDRQRPSW